MQRREFLSATTGLAVAAVVGGLPALAGVETAITACAASPLHCLAYNAPSIWREKLTTGLWRVHGLISTETHPRHDIVVADDLDEHESLQACQVWASLREELTGEEIGATDLMGDPLFDDFAARHGYQKIEHWLPKRFIP